MVEGALVSITLVGCCLGILLVSQAMRAKLDAAYESRYLAFAGATHGCVDGATEPAPQMDPQAQPEPPDPDAEHLKSELENKFNAVTSVLMNTSIGSASATAQGRTFQSRSWVGCIERNHGENSPAPGQDASSMQHQLFAAIPYLWGLIQPLFDFGL
jgi:hypothetical protein